MRAAREDVLAAFEATGAAPVKRHLDTPRVYDALRRALVRAGYDEHIADV
jgi:hypothetical protein